MKIRILLITGILLLVGELSAQNKPHHISKDQIIAKKWEFVMQKAYLTSDDALKVEPIFKATELETWSLIERNRSVFKGSRNKVQGFNIDYEDINDALINFEVESALIQKSYYLKLKTVIAPELINRLLNAEKSYKRDLMQNMSGRKKIITPPTP